MDKQDIRGHHPRLRDYLMNIFHSLLKCYWPNNYSVNPGNDQQTNCISFAFLHFISTTNDCILKNIESYDNELHRQKYSPNLHSYIKMSWFTRAYLTLTLIGVMQSRTERVTFICELMFLLFFLLLLCSRGLAKITNNMRMALFV